MKSKYKLFRNEIDTTQARPRVRSYLIGRSKTYSTPKIPTKIKPFTLKKKGITTTLFGSELLWRDITLED